MFPKLFLSISLFIIMLIMLNYMQNHAHFQAGAAKVNMTPPVSERPTALGGYGDRDGRPAIGVRDSVYARALVLESGNRKCCLISLDLCFTPASIKEEVLKYLKEHDPENKLGFTEENILLSATHSHAAPEAFAMSRANRFGNPRIGIFDSQLLEETAEAIGKAIFEANSKCALASIGIGSIEIHNMSRNRRGDKTIDPELTAIKITDIEGKIKAVWLNFTAHPTILDSDFMEVSGGWPGVLTSFLEQTFSDDAVVLFTNGAQGDQSPIAKAAPTEYDRVLSYAKEMSVQVENLLQKITADQQPEIDMTTIYHQMPPRSISPTFKLTAGKEYNVPQANLQPMVEQLFPEKVPITACLMGDALLMSVPGEMICEIGLRIKQKMKQQGIKHPVIVGLANEYIGSF